MIERPPFLTIKTGLQLLHNIASQKALCLIVSGRVLLLFPHSATHTGKMKEAFGATFSSSGTGSARMDL